MWLMVFSVGLGFGTTVAEPALIAITGEVVGTMARAVRIANIKMVRSDYAMALRYDPREIVRWW